MALRHLVFRMLCLESLHCLVILRPQMSMKLLLRQVMLRRMVRRSVLDMLLIPDLLLVRALACWLRLRPVLWDLGHFGVEFRFHFDYPCYTA